jgi:hypothetical protein
MDPGAPGVSRDRSKSVSGVSTRTGSVSIYPKGVFLCFCVCPTEAQRKTVCGEFAYSSCLGVENFSIFPSRLAWFFLLPSSDR